MADRCYGQRGHLANLRRKSKFLGLDFETFKKFQCYACLKTVGLKYSLTLR